MAACPGSEAVTIPTCSARHCQLHASIKVLRACQVKEPHEAVAAHCAAGTLPACLLELGFDGGLVVELIS